MTAELHMMVASLHGPNKSQTLRKLLEDPTHHNEPGVQSAVLYNANFGNADVKGLAQQVAMQMKLIID